LFLRGHQLKHLPKWGANIGVWPALCVELGAFGFAQKGTKKRGNARCCIVDMHGRQIASTSQGGVVKDLPAVVDR